MNFIFASRRQLSFIITVGARNLLVNFGARNIAGVSVYMTQDENVAKVLRRHSLTRRGIIEEATQGVSKEEEPKKAAAVAMKPKVAVAQQQTKPEPKEPADDATGTEATGDGENAAEMHESTEKPDIDATGVVEVEPDGEPSGTEAGTTGAEPKEREYDNYTVARESICKEFNIKKADVRNPTALARVAQEHGIIIKYKEL